MVKSAENGSGSGQSIAYKFGGFVLDSRELRRDDRVPVPLTPRLLDTLRYLVEHHDKLLDKEEIMEAVWPDSIVEENNLAQAISKLRQVLGEKNGAEFIATIPRRGYRFVAPVRALEQSEQSVPLSTQTFPNPPASKSRRRLVMFVSGAAILLAAVLAFILWQSRSAANRPQRRATP